MNKVIATLVVSVACFTMGNSASASPRGASMSLASPSNGGYGPAASGAGTNGYWTGSSEYSVNSSGVQSIGGTAGRRRVKITGYHPIDGFEAELAAEDAQLRGRRGDSPSGT